LSFLRKVGLVQVSIAFSILFLMLPLLYCGTAALEASELPLGVEKRFIPAPDSFSWSRDGGLMLFETEDDFDILNTSDWTREDYYHGSYHYDYGGGYQWSTNGHYIAKWSIDYEYIDNQTVEYYCYTVMASPDFSPILEMGWTSNQSASVYGVFSPDESYFALLGEDLSIYELPSGTLMWTRSNITGRPEWSPDRSMIALYYNENITAFDVHGHMSFTILNSNISLLNRGWTPDTKYLVVENLHNDTIELYDGHSGLPVRQFSCLGNPWQYTFSPDGRYLALTVWYDRLISVYDLETGIQHLNLTNHTSSINSIAYSPDSRWLASGSWDNTTKIWDASTGALIANITMFDGPVRSVKWSPDGKRLAIRYRDPFYYHYYYHHEYVLLILSKDIDGDGYTDAIDKFRNDPTQWNDTDWDGHGDNVFGNNSDMFPNNAREWRDTDMDGIADGEDSLPTGPDFLFYTFGTMVLPTILMTAVAATALFRRNKKPRHQPAEPALENEWKDDIDEEGNDAAY